MLLTVLNFLYDFAVIISFVSVIVLILSNFIPVVYRLPAQIIAVIIIAVTLFLTGANQEKTKWEKAVAEEVARVQKLEKERTVLTGKINTTLARNRALIKENGRLKDINGFISNEENNNCIIPPGFISLHNLSAENRVSGSSGAGNGPSPKPSPSVR